MLCTQHAVGKKLDQNLPRAVVREHRIKGLESREPLKYFSELMLRSTRRASPRELEAVQGRVDEVSDPRPQRRMHECRKPRQVDVVPTLSAGQAAGVGLGKAASERLLRS